MIRIDFDNFFENIEKLRECFNAIPKPIYARISSGNKGLHIISFNNDDEAFREKYDDPVRLEIDRIRKKYGLTNNVLADVKCYGTERNVSGKWTKIKNKKDTEIFIKEILKL